LRNKWQKGRHGHPERQPKPQLNRTIDCFGSVTKAGGKTPNVIGCKREGRQPSVWVENGKSKMMYEYGETFLIGHGSGWQTFL